MVKKRGIKITLVVARRLVETRRGSARVYFDAVSRLKES